VTDIRKVSGQRSRVSGTTTAPPSTRLSGATIAPQKGRVRLVVDPTLCDGHGVCAELFPERIELDRWGYPMIDGGDIPPGLTDHARRAVTSCPRLALHLLERRP
jgi:ferredoxin